MQHTIAAGALCALAACVSGSDFGYSHLPRGYDWRAVYDRGLNVIVYYGRDPITGDSIYVGPDGRFYAFRHPGRIRSRDFGRPWTPHDVP